MRSDLSGRSAGNISAKRQTSETFTMKKSSTFHGSRMYAPSWHAKPSAMTLKTHSHVKSTVKILLASSSPTPRLEAGSTRGESRARQMDDVTMRKMMNRSKFLLAMTRWQKRRAGLLGAKRHSALSEAAQQPFALALALALAFAFAFAFAYLRK